MEAYVRQAIALAKEAVTNGDHPFGALLVKDGDVVLTAVNTIHTDHDVTRHAELNLVSQAAKTFTPEFLAECTLVTSTEPCAMCAAAISFARIRRLYFAASDTKMGAVENGPRLFNQSTCHHAPDVYGGLSEMDARELLVRFFQDRR